MVQNQSAQNNAKFLWNYEQEAKTKETLKINEESSGSLRSGVFIVTETNLTLLGSMGQIDSTSCQLCFGPSVSGLELIQV